MSLDLKTKERKDITKVEDLSGALYLGKDQYLLQSGEKKRSILYDIKKNKKISDSNLGGGSHYGLVSVDDRNFFAVADALVELKGSKEVLFEAKEYKNRGMNLVSCFVMMKN